MEDDLACQLRKIAEQAQTLELIHGRIGQMSEQMSEYNAGVLDVRAIIRRQLELSAAQQEMVRQLVYLNTIQSIAIEDLTCLITQSMACSQDDKPYLIQAKTIADLVDLITKPADGQKRRCHLPVP